MWLCRQDIQWKMQLRSVFMIWSSCYEKEDDILAEFRYIEAQQHVSVPVEELFMDLANRCKVEDIENFASVFYIAKRSGGDMGNVILKVSRMLGDKIDVKKR